MSTFGDFMKSLFQLSPAGLMVNNMKALAGDYNNVYQQTIDAAKNLRSGVESSDLLGNIVTGMTHSGPTGADIWQAETNSQEAQKQRDWEERLANTQYQRGVDDMRAAGINPAMMFGSASAAPTPSGASATVGSPVQNFSELLALAKIPAEIGLLNAQANKTNKEANEEIPARIEELLSAVSVNKSHAVNLDLDSESKSIINQYLDEQQAFYTASLGLSNEKMIQETKEVVQRVENLKEEQRKIVQDIVESRQRVSLLLAQEGLTKEQTEEVQHLIKKIDAETKQIYKETELTQKDIDWYAATHIVGMIDDTVGAVGSFVGKGLGKGVRALFGKKPKFPYTSSSSY